MYVRQCQRFLISFLLHSRHNKSEVRDINTPDPFYNKTITLEEFITYSRYDNFKRSIRLLDSRVEKGEWVHWVVSTDLLDYTQDIYKKPVIKNPSENNLFDTTPFCQCHRYHPSPDLSLEKASQAISPNSYQPSHHRGSNLPKKSIIKTIVPTEISDSLNLGPDEDYIMKLKLNKLRRTNQIDVSIGGLHSSSGNLRETPRSHRTLETESMLDVPSPHPSRHIPTHASPHTTHLLHTTPDRHRRSKQQPKGWYSSKPDPAHSPNPLRGIAHPIRSNMKRKRSPTGLFRSQSSLSTLQSEIGEEDTFIPSQRYDRSLSDPKTRFLSKNLSMDMITTMLQNEPKLPLKNSPLSFEPTKDDVCRFHFPFCSSIYLHFYIPKLVLDEFSSTLYSTRTKPNKIVHMTKKRPKVHSLIKGYKKTSRMRSIEDTQKHQMQENDTVYMPKVSLSNDFGNPSNMTERSRGGMILNKSGLDYLIGHWSTLFEQKTAYNPQNQSTQTRIKNTPLNKDSKIYRGLPRVINSEQIKKTREDNIQKKTDLYQQLSGALNSQIEALWASQAT